jgi:hypothetical protein
MSVLNRIAYFQNRRDEAPNQELAETKNKPGLNPATDEQWISG